MQRYENEQTELKAEVKALQAEIQIQEQKIQNLEVFIKRVKKYTTLTELTPYALRELVKGIYVEAPDKSSGKRKQKAHIEYDLVGFIPVDDLMKSRKGMTEIIPFPQKCYFTVLRALPFTARFFTIYS